MVHLTPQKVFETALWIQLCDTKKLDIDFFPERIRIRLPSQRHLSLYCSVSKDDMMATLNDMKNQHLIKKEHQTGTWTTYKGNRFVADIIEKQYQTQASMLLGEKMLHPLLERLRTSKPELKELSKEKDVIRSSVEPQKTSPSVDRKILKLYVCECCQSKFYTNDRRRKYCDWCKSPPCMIKTDCGKHGTR
ncbi:hypothetical protein [Methanoregula sp.]|uniref:hypothetical protein n=1 Tax=Methanoregula sp. TaxID=2052170 RepID=UPI0025CB79DB|nr:hypothetical protein [Methanoregula sp.]